MTEKRFRVEKQAFDGYCIVDNHFDGYYAYEKQDLEKLCETLNDLSEEKEQLKKSVKRQQSSNNECAKLIEEQQKENEQLKEEIKDLNDVLARYEEKELKERTDCNEKDCGHCKHLQIDGMFGMWCEKKRNWTEVKYCEDYERDVNDSYLF